MHCPADIRDNRDRGSAGDFLRSKVSTGSQLSIVTAYFTIFGHARLRAEWTDRRLCACSSASHDPERAESKAFLLSTYGLSLGNRLSLKRAALDCAAWIERKVSIRTVRQSGLLHGKLLRIARGAVDTNRGVSADALLGSAVKQTASNPRCYRKSPLFEHVWWQLDPRTGLCRDSRLLIRFGTASQSLPPRDVTSYLFKRRERLHSVSLVVAASQVSKSSQSLRSQ